MRSKHRVRILPVLAAAVLLSSACSNDDEPGLQLTATQPSPSAAAPVGEWQGTFAGTVTWDCGPIGERTGRLHGEFKLTTPEETRAVIDGTNTVTGSCAGPTEGTRTTPISVDGQVVEEGFEFPGDLWGPHGPFTIKVTDDRGSGVLEGPAPGPARVNLAFEIER
jgi:hypothetical protein